MTLADIHTHHPARQGEIVLQQGVHTWGIHPCQVAGHLPQALPPGPWSAVGECGLDALCGVEMEQQEQMLRCHIEWSEEHHLPLILHCVRAQERLLALRRQMQPAMPWIWHGFRGKPQQLVQLVGQGMYISFGPLFNAQSAQACPLERLLVETDCHPLPVGRVYELLAQARGMAVEALAQRVWANCENIFALPKV